MSGTLHWLSTFFCLNRTNALSYLWLSNQKPFPFSSFRILSISSILFFSVGNSFYIHLFTSGKYKKLSSFIFLFPRFWLLGEAARSEDRGIAVERIGSYNGALWSMFHINENANISRSFPLSPSVHNKIKIYDPTALFSHLVNASVHWGLQ